MMDIESKWTTTKCIAAAVVCQPCWISCINCSYNCSFQILLTCWLLYRLHSVDYVAGKPLQTNNGIRTHNAFYRRTSDVLMVDRESCYAHWASTSCRLASPDFCVVCLVLSLLAVCGCWFSLFAHVRFGLLSDVHRRGNTNTSHRIQRRHSLCLHFRLLL